MSEQAPKKSSRLIAFDLMRGYFLLAIILNHLAWYPNLLDFVAARGWLYVSAAEGFFLLSGIILGIVRGRKLIDAPFKKAAKLLLNRGVLLYVVSIALMFTFTLIGWLFFMDNPGLKPGIRPIDQPFIEIVLGAFSLNYIYGWADFLRLYAIFLIISPLAIWLLRAGKWYVLLILSVIIWALFPLAAPYTSTELLMPISWQLIFFGGLTFGFYFDHIRNWWSSLSRSTINVVTRTVLILGATTIVANILLAHNYLVPGYFGELLANWHSTLRPLFNKEALSIPRLVMFALWFWFGFLVFDKFKVQIEKWFGWLLLTFGQRSLYTYSVHAFVIFFAHVITLRATDSVFVNFLLSALIVAIIWVIVKLTPKTLRKKSTPKTT